jgi:hypothetical protein
MSLIVEKFPLFSAIRFKIGEFPSIKFPGTIDATTHIRYLYEHQNPFDVRNPYRFGQYFQDTLSIAIAVTPENYADLYQATLDTSYQTRILWERQSGHQNRVLQGELPYPSKVRFLSGVVSFKVETEAYDEVLPDMPDIESYNLIWNLFTPGDTMWN